MAMFKASLSRSVLITLLAGLLVFSLVVVGTLMFKTILSAQGRNDEKVGGPIELVSTRGDFSLTDLGDHQVAVVTFGYTYCPDVCPMNQAVKKQALLELTEEERERVVPLMISVDPERDSLERLQEYTAFFGESFIGATGTKQQLEELTDRYGVIWRRVEAESSAMGYTIDHSASLYLVNREGDIIQQVLYSSSPEGLVNAIKDFFNS
ncbi:SCO family protein [Halomonas sp. XH26]|nr:SCO family protein [Halomonas sp. XH26]UTA79684.1 SCO family protein [Halomonas sp. XH26]